MQINLYISQKCIIFVAKFDKIMKKVTKISLWTVGSLLAIVFLLLVSLDVTALYVARKQLARVNSEQLHIDLTGVHISLLSQSLSLFGVEVSSGVEDEIGSAHVHAARVHVNHFNVFRALRNRHFQLSDASVYNLDVNAMLPHPEGKLQLRGQDMDIVLRGLAYSDTLRIDSLDVQAESFFVHLTKWHAPEKPYGMPQDGLSRMKMPLSIGRFSVDLDQFDIAMTNPDVQYAEMTITNFSALSRNIENRRNAKVVVNAEAHMAQGGCAWLCFSMTQNTACDVMFDFRVVDAKGAALDGMLRPLIGMTFDCTIDTIKTRLQGNKNGIDGDFMMRYHGLAVAVHPGESPYEVINKNSGAINSAANTLLPKANPSPLTPNNVRRYHVHADRNPMKPFLFMPIMAIVDGLKDIMLPGLFVHKKIKNTPSGIKPMAPKALPNRHSRESTQSKH